MSNAYTVPVLITAACAVAVTVAVRRVARGLRARRGDGVWDQAFIDHLFRTGERRRPTRVPYEPAGTGQTGHGGPYGGAGGDLPPDRLSPLLPAHLTGGYLSDIAAADTPVTRVRTGAPPGAGGLDVVDFADGTSMVVMPGDPETASLIDAALGVGQPVRLLGTSQIGGGYALTFQVHETTVYSLADRVYVRPPG